MSKTKGPLGGTIYHPEVRAEPELTPEEFQRHCWRYQVETWARCDVHPLPNPGSQEAGSIGCTCSVTANAAGKDTYTIQGAPDSGMVPYEVKRTQWHIKRTCKVHGDPPAELQPPKRKPWWRRWWKSSAR